MKKFTLITLFLTAILSLSLFVNQLSAQQETFTTSEYTQASSDGTTYTWQVPPGVNTINIIAIGGGGGGGAVCPTFSSSFVRGCAGGGGGAYVKVDNYTVAPGDVLTIHVGSKGSGHQSCSSTYRGWGGDSWVKLNSTEIVRAKGASDVADGAVNEPGTGGQASACTAPTGSVVLSGGNGGKGSTGAWCGSGGGGAAGGGNGGNGSEPTWTYVIIRHDHPGAAGTNSIAYAGNGAAGVVSHTGGTNGNDGSNYGGGGSGGSSGIGWGDANGGDGGPGYVLITYSATCDATPGSISPETWVCSSTDTAIVINSTAAATSTASGGSYMWQSSTNGTTWSNTGTNAPTYTAHATGYYRRGYVVGTCDPVFTSAVYVTRPSDIDPGTIKDGDNETEKTICAGDAVNITLSHNYSGNVTWQTSPDNENWTTVSTASTYAITGVTATTYVRYLANYTASCGVPSNNVYVITVNALPVVNSIAAPTSPCPGESSYELIANITSSADITAYTWTGATGTGATAQVVPSSYQCGHTYNYSLKVKDANGCESEEVSGNFTTTTPTMTFGTVADVDAVTDGHCHFTVPTEAVLTAAVNNALTSSCNNAVTLSNITPAAGSSIDDDIASVTVRATATDRCGNTYPQRITINVVKPAVPTVSITAGAEYLCPGGTTTLTAVPEAEDPTYQWTPSSLGTGATATTIAYTGEDVVTHVDNYSVVVTDKYGCTGTGNFNVYTTPKAYVANKEYTICSDNAATMSLASDDKVPAGSSFIDPITFNYTTTYTWTIVSNTGVGGASAGTNQAAFTTGTLTNTTLEMQTVVYSVVPTTVTTVEGTEVASCTGDAFTVTVKVRPKVTNDGAITNFDDADVIITLWYGACDTLYYVETPTYDNNILPADLAVYLTNDKGGNVNAGTLLGRIAPGEYTIRWTFTDECGNSIYFDKKYIVRYPNCGDADPNYTDPFYAEDANGILYHTVRIGCECWTAENLRSTKYSDDTNIPSSNVYHSDDYPNDAENEAKFGRLYSWYSAMHVTEGDDTAEPSTSRSPIGPYVQGVCPAGWAVPTVGIYTSMKNISGAIENVKSSDQTTWLPGLAGIAPGSGFNAKGAGYYESYIDRYMNLLGQTDFWTSTIGPTVQKGTCVEITHVCPEMLIKDYMKGYGFSVRCVKRDEILLD